MQTSEVCNHCNGSGQMTRDPDIGTDQECFVCDGTGVNEIEQPTQQQDLAVQPQQEPVAWASMLPNEAIGVVTWSKDTAKAWASKGHIIKELSFTSTPPQPQQEPVAFEIAYASALKESNSGTLKDIAKLCYQAALIVQPTAPVSQKPSWYHKHWGEGDDIFYCNTDAIPDGATPLYTSPPAQRKPWVGLTDAERTELAKYWSNANFAEAGQRFIQDYGSAIETKLRELNKTPTKSQRKPLTNEEIDAATQAWAGAVRVSLDRLILCREFARAIEAAHGIKGTHAERRRKRHSAFCFFDRGGRPRDGRCASAGNA